MFITKILERKGVIQIFGIALILAPFLNTLTKLYVNYSDPSLWTSALYWNYMVNKSTTLQILSALTILCGILMLRGRTSAWRFALFLLGALILNQLVNFGPNYRESWVAVLYLGINILAFAFIVDQLVWKVAAPQKAQTTQPVKKPAPAAQTPVAAITNKPAPVTATSEVKAKVVPLRKVKSLQSRKKILISFAKIGPWAQLTSISSQGFQVKCILSAPPQGLEDREVEFQLKDGPLLKARLSQQIQDEYVFKYVSPSKSDISKLNHWLQQIA